MHTLTIQHQEGGVKTRMVAPVTSLTAAKRWLRVRYPYHRIVAMKPVKPRTRAEQIEFFRCGGLW